MMPQKHSSKSPTGIGHPNAGLTLMEVILSVGLFGVLVAVAAKLNSDQFAAQEHLEVRGEVEDVRDLIRSSIDCEKSMQNQSQLCGTNQYITIRKSDSSVLIATPEPNTGFGAANEDMIEVRSKCTPGDGFDTLDMEYRRTRNGKVIRDKLNNREYNWANLFPAVPVTCPKSQCMKSTLAVSPSQLDFENIPGIYEGRLVDSSLNQYFKGAYGISFVSISGGNLALAKIVQNKSDTPAKFHAWMSVLCYYPGSSYNILCNTPGKSGLWILSTDKSMSTKNIEFDAIYDFPAMTAEFDLADFDGGESWTITPFDIANKPIDTPRIFNTKSGYGTDTGNNALTHLTISSTSTNIRKIKFQGQKSYSPFGFGFDNFTTGIKYCP